MTVVSLRIKELRSDLNSTERKIARYMQENPDELLHLPIAQMAQKAGVSQAAIVRFCKRLGFGGLKDIKATLAGELLESVKESRDSEERYADTQGGSSIDQIIATVTGNHIQALEETAKILDKDAFGRAVEVMLGSKRIDFYGVGASGLVALDAQQKFMRIGVHSLAYTDPHLQITAAATLTPQDAAVFLSYSGRTKDTVDSMRVAGDVGAKTIAVTQYKPSRLSRQADIVLHVCSPELTARSGAMSSRITELAVIDMLFTAMAGHRHEELFDLLLKGHEYTAGKRYK